MDTADVLFVAAEPREMTGAVRHWREVKAVELPVLWARRAMRKGRPVIAVANGAGRERARLAQAAVPYRALCNVGFCGALDPNMRVGDIVVSDRSLPVRSMAPHHLSRLITVDRVARTAGEKAALRSMGAMAVDMEAGGLEGAFYCVKVVSDLATDSFANDFGASLRQDGSLDQLRLFREALKRPWTRVPELVMLAARASFAARNLGDFLETCDF